MEEFKQIIMNLNFANVYWQFFTPIIFSVVDIITGFIQAIINNNKDSKIMRIGLYHKAIIVIIIILSFVVDFTFNLNFVSKIVCIYVIVMEIVSISENIQKAGIDLSKIFELFKNNGKED